MEEKFLHYIWQYKLYNPQNFELPNGDRVEIINPGEYNTDAGPDFFNAKIKIADTIWAGNVEIHINASDWFVHNHHNNSNYNNIILHVVLNNDKEVCRQNGEIIQTVELKYYSSVYNNYKKLLIPNNIIKCSNYISGIESIYINSWMDQLAIERLSISTAFPLLIAISSNLSELNITNNSPGGESK